MAVVNVEAKKIPLPLLDTTAEKLVSEGRAELLLGQEEIQNVLGAIAIGLLSVYDAVEARLEVARVEIGKSRLDATIGVEIEQPVQAGILIKCALRNSRGDEERKFSLVTEEDSKDVRVQGRNRSSKTALGTIGVKRRIENAFDKPTELFHETLSGQFGFRGVELIHRPALMITQENRLLIGLKGRPATPQKTR